MNTYIQNKLDEFKDKIKEDVYGISISTWPNGDPSYDEIAKELEEYFTPILEQSLTDYHNHIVEILNKSIDGCDWCDIEDGKGKYINEKQLAKNIIKNLEILQDTNPKE